MEMIKLKRCLMRLTRGSSGTARAGIPFMRPFQKGFIFQTLSMFNRNEIEQYCRGESIRSSA